MIVENLRFYSGLFLRLPPIIGAVMAQRLEPAGQVAQGAAPTAGLLFDIVRKEIVHTSPPLWNKVGTNI